ncbi:hypothetical protein AB1K32_08230 [Metabacillus dongyingensis]|uniref:hypothetical protein n=1 Tax=Metabacillus dongyingensis TaxID=2874282 RepID=UPI003B8C0DF5
MIWLYLLIPVVLLGGIAVYLEKRSGTIPPDENIQGEKLGEVITQNGINSNGFHDGTN